MKYRILYFAALRDRVGRDSEQIESIHDAIADVYAELQSRHAFSFSPASLRVAVNGHFVEWKRKLVEGDEIVFIPPVSGG